MECWHDLDAILFIAILSLMKTEAAVRRIALYALIFVSAGPLRPVSAQHLETLNASYASITGSRIPLWVAKDAGLFEKSDST